MSPTPGPDADLNATIAAAVNARVESAVLAAFSGDDTLGTYVTAALQRPVEVPSPRGYGKDQVPFMHHLITQSIQDATKRAVQKMLLEEQEAIETAVRDQMAEAIPEFAKQMVGQLVKRGTETYGVQVSLRMPN